MIPQPYSDIIVTVMYLGYFAVIIACRIRDFRVAKREAEHNGK